MLQKLQLYSRSHESLTTIYDMCTIKIVARHNLLSASQKYSVHSDAFCTPQLFSPQPSALPLWQGLLFALL